MKEEINGDGVEVKSEIASPAKVVKLLTCKKNLYVRKAFLAKTSYY